MDKKEALAELKKLYGEKAGYRRNEQALTGDKRQALIEKLPEIRKAEIDAAAARDAKRAELLKDPEYLRLDAIAKQAREARQDASALIHSRRVTVGHTSSMFFHVTGEGDNWAEAIAKAKEKNNA